MQVSVVSFPLWLMKKEIHPQMDLFDLPEPSDEMNHT